MVESVLEHKIYNVRPGDTLLQIAALAKLKYEDLLALNPQVKNPNLIFAGQALILPKDVSRHKLIVAASNQIFTGDEPAWLKIARHEIGVAEKDSGNNPRILEYLATTTLSNAEKQTDATAWCSAFVNWSLRTAGESGTDSAWALSWKDWGRSVPIARNGAIAVFTRTSDSTNGGHVGFFLGETGSRVTLLGGNQGNSVSISDYPKNGTKGSYTYVLQGYRWPA